MPKKKSEKLGFGKKKQGKAAKNKHYKTEAETAAAKDKEKDDTNTKDNKPVLKKEPQDPSVINGNGNGKGDDSQSKAESMTLLPKANANAKGKEEDATLEAEMVGLKIVQAKVDETVAAFKDRIGGFLPPPCKNSNSNSTTLSFAERTKLGAGLPGIPGAISWKKPDSKEEEPFQPASSVNANSCVERACVEKPAPTVDFSREANNNSKRERGSPVKDAPRDDPGVNQPRSAVSINEIHNGEQVNGVGNGVGNGIRPNDRGDGEGEREQNGDEEGQAPGPPRDVLADYEHPLHRTWVLHFFKPVRELSWNESWFHICTFSTAEAFWRYWNYVQNPSTLLRAQQYAMFEAGVRPTWEDPGNFRGGRWLWEMSVPERQHLDTNWLNLMLDVMGETLAHEESMPLVKGVVVDIRARNDRLAIWLSRNVPKEAVVDIGRQFKAAMNMDPRLSLPFTMHDDSANRRGSSTKVCIKV